MTPDAHKEVACKAVYRDRHYWTLTWVQGLYFGYTVPYGIPEKSRRSCSAVVRRRLKGHVSPPPTRALLCPHPPHVFHHHVDKNLTSYKTQILFPSFNFWYPSPSSEFLATGQWICPPCCVISISHFVFLSLIKLIFAFQCRLHMLNLTTDNKSMACVL